MDENMTTDQLFSTFTPTFSTSSSPAYKHTNTLFSSIQADPVSRAAYPNAVFATAAKNPFPAHILVRDPPRASLARPVEQYPESTLRSVST